MMFFQIVVSSKSTLLNVLENFVLVTILYLKVRSLIFISVLKNKVSATPGLIKKKFFSHNFLIL